MATVARWEHIRFVCTIIAALAAIGTAVAFAKMQAADANLRPMPTLEALESTRAIAEAKARAAEANTQLARLKVEERLTDRTISPEQQMEIARKLKSHAGRSAVIICASTPEQQRLAIATNSSLRSAGWNLGGVGVGDPKSLHGIRVEVGLHADEAEVSAAKDLVAVLTECGLSVIGPDIGESFVIPMQGIRIMIGER